MRIEVKLESRFQIVAVTYADNEGRFSFNDLPASLYHVVISDPAYEPVRAEAALSSISAQNAYLQIYLNPKMKDRESPAKAITGSNPYLLDAKNFSEKYPKSAVKEYESGVKAIQRGKTGLAIERFQRSIEIAPDFYQARNNLGSIFLNERRFPEAEQQFQQVIRSQQADAAAYFNLANVLLLTDKPQQCLQNIQEGLKREPNSAVGQYLLGTLYSRQGRVPDAQRYLRAALESDPTMSKVHLELVNLYLRQQMAPQAMDELKIFLERFPSDPLAPKAKEVLARLQSAATK